MQKIIATINTIHKKLSGMVVESEDYCPDHYADIGYECDFEEVRKAYSKSFDLVEVFKEKDLLIRELLEVVEFYRWTHPSELFEIDEYTVSTNPMVTSSGKKALSILNSESVKNFKEKDNK